MSTITIELCAEDRARLDSILAALQNSKTDCERCAGTVAEMFAGKQEPTAAEAPAAVQAEPPKENVPQATVEEVQAAVVRLTAAGRKAEAREIVHAYADRISAIPEDRLGEALQRLQALEG